MNINLTIEYPQVPRGAASRYAYRCFSVKLYLHIDNEKYIVRSSERILTWKSGNISSTGARIMARAKLDYEREIAEFDDDPRAWFSARTFKDSTPGVRAARAAKQYLQHKFAYED
jgi:hypothetical protein